MPDTRTGHNINNVEILAQDDGECRAALQLDHAQLRYDIVDIYFGISQYTLDSTGATPLIKRKYVVLKNDYIHHVLDIYHI